VEKNVSSSKKIFFQRQTFSTGAEEIIINMQNFSAIYKNKFLLRIAIFIFKIPEVQITIYTTKFLISEIFWKVL